MSKESEVQPSKLLSKGDILDWQNTAAVSIYKATYLIQAMTDINLFVSFQKKKKKKRMKNETSNRFRPVIKKAEKYNFRSGTVWMHSH